MVNYSNIKLIWEYRQLLLRKRALINQQLNLNGRDTEVSWPSYHRIQILLNSAQRYGLNPRVCSIVIFGSVSFGMAEDNRPSYEYDNCNFQSDIDAIIYLCKPVYFPDNIGYYSDDVGVRNALNTRLHLKADIQRQGVRANIKICDRDLLLNTFDPYAATMLAGMYIQGVPPYNDLAKVLEQPNGPNLMQRSISDLSERMDNDLRNYIRRLERYKRGKEVL